MALAGAEEKFFFHMHNFDDEVIDEPPPEEIEEDLPPPPPMFTESELEAAKKQAFQEGHTKGVEETEASRAQALASMMQRLANDLSTLFAAEKAREDTYESEVIRLCHAVFEKTFPTFHNKHGFDALTQQLEEVFKNIHGQREVEIRVSEDYAKGVEAFADKLHAQNSDLKITTISDTSLESGAFRLGWKDGGALYDIPALAATISSNLEEMLAGKPVPSHNDSSEESNISGGETPAGNETDDNPITEDDEHDG